MLTLFFSNLLWFYSRSLGHPVFGSWVGCGASLSWHGFCLNLSFVGHSHVPCATLNPIHSIGRINFRSNAIWLSWLPIPLSGSLPGHRRWPIQAMYYAYEFLLRSSLWSPRSFPSTRLRHHPEMPPIYSSFSTPSPSTSKLIPHALPTGL